MSVSDWSQKIKFCVDWQVGLHRSAQHHQALINYKGIYESRHSPYTWNTGDDAQVKSYFLSEEATWSWVLTILSWISSIVNSISSGPPQPFWYCELGVGVKWFVFCPYEDCWDSVSVCQFFLPLARRREVENFFLQPNLVIHGFFRVGVGAGTQVWIHTSLRSLPVRAGGENWFISSFVVDVD